MRRLIKLRRLTKPPVRLLAAVGVVTSVFWFASGTGMAALLTGRGFTFPNSNASAVTDYTITLQVNSSSTLGSILVEVCSNSPLEVEACVAPNGFDISHATIISQSGLGNLSIFSQTANTIIFTHPPAAIVPPQQISIKLNNVTSPSASGSYYGKLTTFASTDASGPSTDFGGLAFAITDNLQLTTIVPPYLGFCAAVQITAYDCRTADGNYVNLGNLSSTTTRSGQTQLVVATNAFGGYIIQTGGATLLSGNNVIAAMGIPAASQIGTAQFGINLRANATPLVGADVSGPGLGEPTTNYDTPNRYLFVPNDIIAQSSNADDYRKYTVSYIVNIPPSQPAGVYVSTITFVCTGSF